MKIIKSALEIVKERNQKRLEEGFKEYRILAVTDLFVLVGIKNEKDNFYSFHIIKSYVEFDGRERELPIEVYFDDEYDGKIRNAEVNWSAFGDVTPEFANEYANIIQSAASFANLINGKDYKEELDK